jgi:regulator of nonsense transcripts 1
LGLALNSQVESRTLHKLLESHFRQEPDSELALLHKKVFGQGKGGDLSLIYGKLANWLENEYNHHQHSLDPENYPLQITHSIPEQDNSGLYSLAARILRRAPKPSDTKVSQVEERRYKLLLHEARSAILQNADVITTTCVLSGDKSILGKFKFAHVIIDEVSQTLEPELLIPMTYQAQHVVLIGDDKQLGPICRSDEAKRLFYNHSLFFRLSQTKTCYRTLLNEQYRMHPAIARFSSSVFYDGKILNGVDEKARSHVPYSSSIPHFAGDCCEYRLITHKICVLHPYFFPWPNPRVPIAFIPSVDGQERMKGFSKYNIAEVLWVERIIAHLVLRGMTLKQIGVISPYAAQNTAIINILKDPQRLLVDAIRQRNKTHFPLATAANALEEIHDHLQVSTVDAFQGQEREFIIFSAVATKFVGFLKDERRLNVALTRAQYGFFLIANENCLLSDKTWAKLFTHFTAELQCKMSSGL